MIKIENLTKRYAKRTVLHNLTMTLPHNEFIGLVGRNGVGKTTFLRLLAGYAKPTTGTIHMLDKNPFTDLTLSANSLLMDDTFRFPSYLTLEKGLTILEDFYPNFDCTFAQKTLAYFNIPLSIHQEQLSKGMNAIFRLVIALSVRTPFTFLDEPMNGIDAANRQELKQLLLKEMIKFPRTIIFSSHHLEEVENLLSYVLILHNGQLAFIGETTVLQAKYLKLIGKESIIREQLPEEMIIHQVGESPLMQFIIENTLTIDEKKVLEKRGIQLQPCTICDSYIYLTETKKGGILTHAYTN